MYANSLLAHGTGRGEPWVRYMTAMFSQNVYENIRAMEIFGNDLYKGNMDEFLPLFTAERFPKLDSIDMSCTMSSRSIMHSQWFEVNPYYRGSLPFCHQAQFGQSLL